MQGTIVRILAGSMVAMVAAASLAPSVAINIDHAMNTGGQWSLLVLAVMSVLAAPICLAALPNLLAHKRFDLAGGAAVLFVVALVFNLSNAVGLAGGARDHQREGRERKIARVSNARERLTMVAAMVADGRKTARDETPAMIDAELIGLRADPIFARSKSCVDVTLPDSKTHCGKIADALRRHGAAERVRQLEIERAELVAKVDAWGVAPSTPDAKVDRLARLTGIGEMMIGISLNVNTALLAELLGAFLPAIAFAVVWPIGRNDATVAQARPVVSEEKPPVTPPAATGAPPAKPQQTTSGKSVSSAIPDSVRLFADRCLIKRPGANIQAKDLFASYCADCRDALMTPETQKRFGLAMAELGFEKKDGRVIQYLNVALRGNRPALVAIK